MAPHLVGQNTDTFIGNARINGDFLAALAEQFEDLKRRSQEAEEDLLTPWQFAGEVLFIKPHGAGRQWRDEPPSFLRQLAASDQVTALLPSAFSTRIAQLVLSVGSIRRANT